MVRCDPYQQELLENIAHFQAETDNLELARRNEFASTQAIALALRELQSLSTFPGGKLVEAADDAVRALGMPDTGLVPTRRNLLESRAMTENRRKAAAKGLTSVITKAQSFGKNAIKETEIASNALIKGASKAQEKDAHHRDCLFSFVLRVSGSRQEIDLAPDGTADIKNRTTCIWRSITGFGI